VYQLQLVVVQQAAEEVSHREVQAALEEGTEDDLLLDVLARKIFPDGCTPLHLHLRPKKHPVHQHLDLVLGHGRLDPSRLGVRDANCIHRHLRVRVCDGSNVAQGLNAHMPEAYSAKRWQ
jgi:hypothetical protein